MNQVHSLVFLAGDEVKRFISLHFACHLPLLSEANDVLYFILFSNLLVLTLPIGISRKGASALLLTTPL